MDAHRTGYQSGLIAPARFLPGVALAVSQG
jgi:hypothetical protein